MLDILAHRNKSGSLSGTILVNGRKLNRRSRFFGRISGYVYQDDKLFGSVTVTEAIRFIADMKLPIPHALKEERVKRVIEMLGLTHVANSMIGVPGRGISGGERRRVSIAMEVVVDPPILFLDEV